jgi:hypothetical protein
MSNENKFPLKKAPLHPCTVPIPLQNGIKKNQRSRDSPGKCGTLRLALPYRVRQLCYRYATGYTPDLYKVSRGLVGDVAQQFYVLRKNNHNHMENASIPIRALYGIRGVSALLPYRESRMWSGLMCTT